MIIVYTGNGKGKSSAAVGQAVRAYGQGLTVAFGQFMKRLGQSGEQHLLSILLQDRFRAGGQGFYRKGDDWEKHRLAAERLVRWSTDMLPCVDMLILDEILYALGHRLVLEGELTDLLRKARQQEAHLVLSGRGLPAWLAAEADLITEMREEKHPFAEGGSAVPGIEF